MQAKRLGALYAIAATIWAVVILVLTLTPGPYMPKNALFSFDKIGHTGIFAIQTFLILMALMHYGKIQHAKDKLAFVAVGLATSYGALIEVVQSQIPGRGMEYLDGLANMLGCLFGLLGFVFVRYFLAKKETRSR